MIKPALSLVFALYSLQNAAIFTPCCPNAGPTGGAGVAFPAGKASLINAVIFLHDAHIRILKNSYKFVV